MVKYVLVQNNQILLGPFNWIKTRFESVIQEDFEIDVVLPSDMPSDIPYLVNQDLNLWIYTARPGEDIPYNPRIEVHNGPFWTFNDKYAEYHYEPILMDLEIAKKFLIEKVAAERYKKEIKGIKETIQNTEITIDTTREGRAIFIQKYSIMQDTETVNWKFPESWLTINKSEFLQIITSFTNYIQQCFDWEKQLVNQINSCNSHTDLLPIVIEEQETPLIQPNLNNQ